MNPPLSIKSIKLSIIKCIDTLFVENESDPFPMEGQIFQVDDKSVITLLLVQYEIYFSSSDFSIFLK